MKKLKLVVIGCGGIAKYSHLPALTEINEVEVVGLCDIKIEKAEALAEKFNIKKVYTDYKEILEDEEIDAVDICTPNYLHSIIAVEALKKGKDVFCEKPDAVSVEEVLKMKTASEESGKLLMVMRNNRYRNDTQFLKKYIEDGNLGEIYAAKCGWIRRRGIPGKGGWFTTKDQSGGGPLIDIGVHMIDVTIWLMGNPTPISVTGSTFCKFANNDNGGDSIHSKFGEAKADGIFDVEDLAMGFIKFDNGACLSIEFSWASNIDNEKNYFDLLGTNQGASCHQDGKIKIAGESNGITTDIIPNIPIQEDSSHGRNLQHFVNCILHDEKPQFVPQQGVNIIKILEALYKSAESGREVIL